MVARREDLVESGGHTSLPVAGNTDIDLTCFVDLDPSRGTILIVLVLVKLLLLRGVLPSVVDSNKLVDELRCPEKQKLVKSDYVHI